MAVKIQYPGVSESIDSDLESLKTLVKYFKVLPESFYLDKFVKNTRKELKEECDYGLEKRKQMLYRKLIQEYSDPALFGVPRVIGSLLLR